MTGRRHQSHLEDLAPYALGALSPAEAEALEAHLRGCAECQRELAQLRVGAEALARSVEQLEPPASLRARVLDRVLREAEPRPDHGAAAAGAPTDEERRRALRAPRPGSQGEEERGRPGRRLWRALGRLGARVRPGQGASSPRRPPRPAVAVLAAALVALVAGAAGWALGGGDAESPRTVAATVDRDRLPNARARLTMTADGEDPVLHIQGLRQLGPQRTYEVWIQRDGRLAPGPLFSPTPEGAAVTGIPGDPDGVEAVFVTREPAGGARTPSETPVISVPLPS